jgi:transketolase N-terminal domain/subunit
MGAAAIGVALFREAMRYNPRNPLWLNRDRCQHQVDVLQQASVTRRAARRKGKSEKRFRGFFFAAAIGVALFREAMRYNPRNPLWLNRDRFVLYVPLQSRPRNLPTSS